MNRARGFTLPEVLVAVAVGAVMAYASMHIVAVIIDAALSGVNAAKVHEARVLVLRRLRSILESAEPPRDSARFVGDVDRMQFTGSHRADGAGFISEGLELRKQGHELVVIALTGRRVLTAPAESLAIEYLLSRGRHAPFVRRWSSGSALPVALRLRLWHGTARGGPVVDTVLVRTGGA